MLEPVVAVNGPAALNGTKGVVIVVEATAIKQSVWYVPVRPEPLIKLVIVVPLGILVPVIVIPIVRTPYATADTVNIPVVTAIAPVTLTL